MSCVQAATRAATLKVGGVGKGGLHYKDGTPVCISWLVGFTGPKPSFTRLAFSYKCYYVDQKHLMEINKGLRI